MPSCFVIIGGFRDRIKMVNGMTGHIIYLPRKRIAYYFRSKNEVKKISGMFREDKREPPTVSVRPMSGLRREEKKTSCWIDRSLESLVEETRQSIYPD